MDELPDAVVWEILRRMNTTADKSSVSLTCKRFHELDNDHRISIRVGWGLNPANEGLLSLCKRFRNLRRVEISYTGLKPELGQQLDDVGLYNLSISCPFLADLTLSSCIDIADTGLSHLASCSNLSALKLIVAPRITGRGMSSVVAGCKKLASIHLDRCWEIAGLDWLGGVEKLEDLCIKGRAAIIEGYLIKLGSSLLALKWQSIPPWDNMLHRLGRGLSCISGKYHNLEKIHLDTCLGVEDSDIISLARNSTNLRSISLEVPSDLLISIFDRNHPKITDESLKALAQNCSRLESVRIAFSIGYGPSNKSFSIHGILDLVHRCPIRELTLERVHLFGDAGMRALRGAESLEMVELIYCDGISDVGIQLAASVPRLRVLKLDGCVGITNNAFEPLKRQRKLEVLAVSDCPYVFEEGVEGAADSVSFKEAWSDMESVD